MDKREAIDYQSKISSLESTIAEQNMLINRLKATIDEYKSKEQSISSAIIASMEHANQLEASRKKLYLLDIQRSRLMYLRMEQIINELYARYPELTKDSKLKDMSERFKSMVYKELSEQNNDTYSFDIKKQATVVDDPIKKLLHNIIDVFDTKKANEASKRATTPAVTPNTSAVKPLDVGSSGFDLNEALHPTMELAEILKALKLGDADDN